MGSEGVKKIKTEEEVQINHKRGERKKRGWRRRRHGEGEVRGLGRRC